VLCHGLTAWYAASIKRLPLATAALTWVSLDVSSAYITLNYKDFIKIAEIGLYGIDKWVIMCYLECIKSKEVQNMATMLQRQPKESGEDFLWRVIVLTHIGCNGVKCIDCTYVNTCETACTAY